jgi:Cytochrome P450
MQWQLLLGAADFVRLPYLNATLKEAMRLYPPSTSLFTRVVLRDVLIGATRVAKGTLSEGGHSICDRAAGDSTEACVGNAGSDLQRTS